MTARGLIRIGKGTSLGDKGAPRIGDGAITLQTRNTKAEICIGSGCAFSNNITIVATDSITIGDLCLIGDQVMIMDSDFHRLNPKERAQPAEPMAVRIGNNVWLGSRVMVLKGATIGDNSVVAAGAIVVSEVPPNTLVAGIPARIIRTLD